MHQRVDEYISDSLQRSSHFLFKREIKTGLVTSGLRQKTNKQTKQQNNRQQLTRFAAATLNFSLLFVFLYETLPLHYLCIRRNSVYVFQTEHEVHWETNVTQSKQRPKQMRLQEAAH